MENIDTATVLISGDFKQIMNVKTVNNFLQLFGGENALLKGKEKEILSRALNFSVDLSHFDINNPLSSAFKVVEKQIGSLPATQLIASALPQALEEEYTKRIKEMNQLIHKTIDLVKSSEHLTTADAARAVTEIFRTTNPSSVYEANKHKLNSGIRSIVEPCVQLYKQFQDQKKKFLKINLWSKIVLTCYDNKIFHMKHL
ncbi:unnamed protein product [Rotaria sp. Silwood2]|nr:unnamed protein product [Rotaria sp. Silwood2]CAF4513554.1 unnamed protein product [Rotaria sp. Silwood2]